MTFALLVSVSPFCGSAQSGGGAGATRGISIILVRHAETDATQTALPLTAEGERRAELLQQTLRDVNFTHVFATHTARTRQTIEGIARVQSLTVIQLPVPGSVLHGQVVSETTSRRVPIEPISAALLKLPAGSVALVALNSENLFAILNRLGVPAAPPGTVCAPGSMCVPCTNNSCYPKEYDQLWHLVLAPGKKKPLALIELHYGAGWQPSAQTRG